MKVKIYKSTPKGTLYVPPSKSYSHRYLIAAMLANSNSKISNIYFSNDIMATLNCLSSFGCKYNIKDDSVIITSSNEVVDKPIFDCFESGSTLRFLIPIALSKYDNVTFIGTEKLISRGIGVYEEIFKKQNIKIIKDKTSLTFKGHLKSGVFEVNGSISSQFITGLLFTLPLLDGDSIIKIIPPLYSKDYVDMTLDVLSRYKINYEVDGYLIKIKGNQTYIASDYSIEGDYSNAAFLMAFNYLGGNINVLGLNESSLQGDKVFVEYFKKLNEENATLDISNCIDLGPVLMVFAAIKHGAKFTGTSRLKIKESDRALAIKEELNKVGINVLILEDEVIVYKSTLLKPTSEFNSHNDHRIAMALSMLSVYFDININNAEAINKSYPHYFKELKKVGVKIEYDVE